jgi:hypothetical protein
VRRPHWPASKKARHERAFFIANCRSSVRKSQAGCSLIRLQVATWLQFIPFSYRKKRLQCRKTLALSLFGKTIIGVTMRAFWRFRGLRISVSKAQETELMHVQFAHAAKSKTSDGEASIGVAACAAWPADGVSVEGDSHAGRFAPSSAPFNKEN